MNSSGRASAPAPLVSRPLHWWIVLTALMTLALVGAGGLVTSHGVGMAVPDWPNTYGYNMFFFPVSRWVGGIFYEHTHRLIASTVGLMTGIMAIWLFGRRARGFLRWLGVVFVAGGALSMGLAPARWADGVVGLATGAAALVASCGWPRSDAAPRWLRWLGVFAFVAVVLQGVLGGLRVVLFKDEIGIFHATLAQLFFAVVCSLAVVTSRWWARTSKQKPEGALVGRESHGRGAPAWLIQATTGLILLQLILGAAMRHQHAGLAIPDFPLAYGKIWPATDKASVEVYNERRVEVVSAKPITGAQIILQMIHRATAVAILAAVASCAWLSWRAGSRAKPARALATALLVLVVVQVLLGAATIWSNKAADIATVHVMVGALLLATGTVASMVASQSRAWCPHCAEGVGSALAAAWGHAGLTHS